MGELASLVVLALCIAVVAADINADPDGWNADADYYTRDEDHDGEDLTCPCEHCIAMQAARVEDERLAAERREDAIIHRALWGSMR